MAKYLALQIKKGNLNYDDVTTKFPHLKIEIDGYLNVD